MSTSGGRESTHGRSGDPAAVVDVPDSTLSVIIEIRLIKRALAEGFRSMLVNHDRLSYHVGCENLTG
jgi:hypothetical protein